MENRRDFIKKMAGFTAALSLPAAWACSGPASPSDKFGQLLPLRKLGKTGEKVTMLGVGGYHIGWTTEQDAREVIETAIEGGIRFFDTAHNYGNGTSEERYGKYLIPKYRDHIFLMTKSQASDGESLLQEFDLSLQRMNTDYVDLLQLHSLKSPADVDERISNEVLDALLSVRESGKARYIGFTGHQSPYAHLRMLEKLNSSMGLSTLQIPVNAVDFISEHSFIKLVMEQAIDSELGILAMKTLADGRFFANKARGDRVLWETETPVVPDQISIREALFFSWSMPVSVLITGAENKELLSEKIQLARDFAKLDESEKDLILYYMKLYNADNWISATLEEPLLDDPGERMRYNTFITHLLSGVITRATGMNTKEFADEKLFGPLGINIDYWDQDPQGIYFGGNSMHITAREMAAFGYLYIMEGNLNGVQIVSKDWIEQSLTPSTDITHPVSWGHWKNYNYAWLWWIGEFNEYTSFMGYGYGGQFLVIFPEIELIVVSNCENDIPPEATTDQEWFIFEIISEYILPSVKD